MCCFLGELSPMQESKLVQLKSRVSDLLKGKVPSDPVFLRFLRARDFNVDKVINKYIRSKKLFFWWIGNYFMKSFSIFINYPKSIFILCIIGKRNVVSITDLA